MAGETYLQTPRPFFGIGSYDRHDVRFFCFLIALLIYAFWGEPTPDHIGWDEYLVGGFLVLAVGSAGPASLSPYNQNGRRGLFRSSGQIFLLYGLSVPLVMALAQGHHMTLILRDIIPFLFMMLPLFLISSFTVKRLYAPAIRFAIILCGLIFAMRAIASYQAFTGMTPFFPALGENSYLANAPTVMFTAIFFAGVAGYRLYCSVAIRSVFTAALFLLPALMIFALMYLVQQRAGLALGAAGLFLLLLLAFVKAPRRALAPGLVVFFFAVFFWPELHHAVLFIIEKTKAVGLNNRVAEAVVVLDAIGSHYGTVFFGKGWGATIESPAVGGMSVNYTHSLVTTYMLKTGAVGTVLAGGYLLAFAKMIFDIFKRDPVMATALAIPFIIDCFLYASFKSLDFGLLLLLIALWAAHGESLHKRAACSIQKDNSEE